MFGINPVQWCKLKYGSDSPNTLPWIEHTNFIQPTTRPRSRAKLITRFSKLSSQRWTEARKPVNRSKTSYGFISSFPTLPLAPKFCESSIHICIDDFGKLASIFRRSAVWLVIGDRTRQSTHSLRPRTRDVAIQTQGHWIYPKIARDIQKYPDIAIDVGNGDAGKRTEAKRTV